MWSGREGVWPGRPIINQYTPQASSGSYPGGIIEATKILSLRWLVHVLRANTVCLKLLHLTPRPPEITNQHALLSVPATAATGSAYVRESAASTMKAWTICLSPLNMSKTCVNTLSARPVHPLPSRQPQPRQSVLCPQVKGHPGVGSCSRDLPVCRVII